MDARRRVRRNTKNTTFINIYIGLAVVESHDQIYTEVTQHIKKKMRNNSLYPENKCL